MVHENLIVSEEMDTWLKMGWNAVCGICATVVWGLMADPDTVRKSPVLFLSIVLLITMTVSLLIDSAILTGVAKLGKTPMPSATSRLLVATAMLVYVAKFLAIIVWSLFLHVGSTPMAQLLPLSVGYLTGIPKLYSLDLFFFSYIAFGAWMLRHEPKVVMWGWGVSVLVYNALLLAI